MLNKNMKVCPKMALSFSILFVIGFTISSFLAHVTLETSLINLGLTEKQIAIF